MNALNELEVLVLLFVQENLRSPALTAIMRCITVLGNGGLIAIATTLLLIAMKRYRRVGLACAASLLMEFLLVNLLLKNIVARIRPYVVSDALTVLTNIPHDFSFPSGHAGSVFAVAAVMLCWMPRKWGIPAILLASLIALSRLYVGVHYPTDVLVAVLIGCLTAIAGRALVLRFWPKAGKKAAIHSSRAA